MMAPILGGFGRHVNCGNKDRKMMVIDKKGKMVEQAPCELTQHVVIGGKVEKFFDIKKAVQEQDKQWNFEFQLPADAEPSCSSYDPVDGNYRVEYFIEVTAKLGTGKNPVVKLPICVSHGIKSVVKSSNDVDVKESARVAPIVESTPVVASTPVVPSIPVVEQVQDEKNIVIETNTTPSIINSNTSSSQQQPEINTHISGISTPSSSSPLPNHVSEFQFWNCNGYMCTKIWDKENNVWAYTPVIFNGKPLEATNDLPMAPFVESESTPVVESTHVAEIESGKKLK
jgi:hypothetical protein